MRVVRWRLDVNDDIDKGRALLTDVLEALMGEPYLKACRHIPRANRAVARKVSTDLGL